MFCDGSGDRPGIHDRNEYHEEIQVMEIQELLEVFLRGFLLSVGAGMLVELMLYGVSKAFSLVNIR